MNVVTGQIDSMTVAVDERPDESLFFRSWRITFTPFASSEWRDLEPLLERVAASLPERLRVLTASSVRTAAVAYDINAVDLRVSAAATADMILGQTFEVVREQIAAELDELPVQERYS